jgi:hypothetical protein
MKTLALAALTLSLLASTGHAKESRTDHVRSPGAAANGASGAPKAVVAIGRDGQDAGHHCSNENPNIEYRDCVNASTRDPNAKVRLG